MAANLCKNGYIFSAPRAQLKPMQNGLQFIIEMKNASVFYPDKVLPAASMIVPEMNNGNFLRPDVLKNSS